MWEVFVNALPLLSLVCSITFPATIITIILNKDRISISKTRRVIANTIASITGILLVVIFLLRFTFQV